MRILGIDPGLATMGYGIIDKIGNEIKLIKYGTVSTPAGQPFPLRLKSIDFQLTKLLNDYRPDEIAFEELFFQRNVTTAFTVGAARGVAICVCSRFKPDGLYEYTPLQIKQAIVGYGRAEKQQIQQMVKLMLKLDETPKPDDAADAIACALTHAGTGAHKLMFKMK